MKQFKPMKAPNEQIDLDIIKYSLLASTKLDGCRLLSYKGRLVTCSLKLLQNKQLREKFEPIRKRTDGTPITLIDGELYGEGIPFYMITSCFMTKDYTSKTAIKHWKKLCNQYEIDLTRDEVLNKLKFYVFDCIQDERYEEAFIYRTQKVSNIAKEFPDLIVPVVQIVVTNAKEVRTMFKEVLDRGYEGLMLRSIKSRYKCGRGTVKEALIFKVKPYVTIDAQIIGVKQATKVDPKAPKTTNELGRSVTSKKQEDRILIPRAKTFTVNYTVECPICNGDKINNETYCLCTNCNENAEIKHKVDVGIGGEEKERDEIWANKESYIGRWIEYKGLLVGSKDVPRHCNMERWREEKDEK